MRGISIAVGDVQAALFADTTDGRFGDVLAVAILQLRHTHREVVHGAHCDARRHD